MLRHRRGRRRENAPVGVEPTRTAEAFSASGVGGVEGEQFEGRQEPGGDLAAALLPHRALDESDR